MEVLNSIPKTNKEEKGKKKPTISWTILHFTPTRSSTWQLSTQFWVINRWASKGKQIIYVWELDPIKCSDSTASFTLIYSIGPVFVVSELFIPWVRMLPLKGHESIHSHVTVFDLCCFSPSLATLHWSTVTLRMGVKTMSSGIDCTCFLYALTVAWIWKIGSTCYPTHIFLFIDGKWTNPLPKQCNKDYKMRIQRQHYAECWGQPHGSCISH